MSYREALYSVHFHIAIISLIFQQNADVQLNMFVLLTKYLLHISAPTLPSSGRTLHHFSKPFAYGKVVTKGELQSMKYIICGFFYKVVYNYTAILSDIHIYIASHHSAAEHRASTRILHLTLFLASVLISVQVLLTLLASSSTVLRHVFLSLPLPVCLGVPL
jgi:hypothetical protein